jgi:hypothetical protein
MQCGKVMAWNKICRLTAHSVANITPWCYLVSGFLLYPSVPKQTQNLSETGSIFRRRMKGSKRHLLSWVWQMQFTLVFVQSLIDWKIRNDCRTLTLLTHSLKLISLDFKILNIYKKMHFERALWLFTQHTMLSLISVKNLQSVPTFP